MRQLVPIQMPIFGTQISLNDTRIEAAHAKIQAGPDIGICKVLR